MKIAHVSDLHFGRLAGHRVVDALIRDICHASVSLVAVSGDLTQRAFRRQFAEAVKFIDKLPPPVIVVPGNHDVYPWWRPINRIYRPLRKFNQYFKPNRPDSLVAGDVAFLGINSAHGRTIKGGKISIPSIDRVKSFFGNTGAGTFKVLMLHHHLIQLDGLFRHDVSIEGDLLWEIAGHIGVDLILCGHLHVSHVESLPCKSGREIVVASAGTATSSRGRRSNKGRNLYILIDVQPGYFTIQERSFMYEATTFQVEKETRFERIKQD